jgi:hypothetical protein
MKNVPVTCIDNFYKDPDKIREYALSLEYFQNNGRYPGKRSDHLSDLNPDLFNQFCTKLMGIYFDFTMCWANWDIQTYFQLIDSQHDDPLSPKNSGLIHLDDDKIIGGIIYLTPDIDASCGTSIFKTNHSINYTPRHSDNDKKIISDFYKDNIDNNYDSMILNHNSKFKETGRFSNEYNRLVAFDSQTYHGVNSFYTKSQRLTQVFFVNELTTNSTPPIVRMNNSIL